MSTSDTPRAGAIETWQIRKPAVETDAGMVASQHHVASDIGARVLADGGNAVDAAVAAGLAIGTVEPWMSGLGGGGQMIVYLAAEGRAYNVDFGMRAPRDLDPGAYPLTGAGTDDDLFGWPAVLEERNVNGPLAMAVPGFVAGMAMALARFGTLSWRDALAPAIDSARRGMVVDWYATLKIASAALVLSRYPESARVYLPGGFAPSGEWGGPVPTLVLGQLADTLERLAEAGARDFYEGEVARAIVADCTQLGCPLSGADLAHYEAAVREPETFSYRDATVHAAPGLTAGPTLRRALARLAERHRPGDAPDADTYAAFAASLAEAYAERLETMGDEIETRAPTSTTHLSVVDRDGNAVALTQTLLSVFGSKVVLPQSGILMNNGIMWFDPRPGRPNSMAPGKRPLSNMCPTVVETGDGRRFAVGASGGRRIMPAVMQLVSFLTDFRMDVESACHQPRIDMSGAPPVIADARLPDDVVRRLAAAHAVVRAQNTVYPALFACPNLVLHDARRGVRVGGAFVTSPWSKASAG
ncbi:MAG: gamma-glutamyltransferase [Gammaproteobacteria bacterium]|nr:gamma-glutamyltransferase [Gammaproteobacteria bacterium]